MKNVDGVWMSSTEAVVKAAPEPYRTAVRNVHDSVHCAIAIVDDELEPRLGTEQCTVVLAVAEMILREIVRLEDLESWKVVNPTEVSDD